MVKAADLQQAAYYMSSRDKALELAKRPVSKYQSVQLGEPPNNFRFSLEGEHEAWLMRCFLHNIACYRTGLIDDKLKSMGVDVEGLSQPMHPGQMP